MSAVIHEGVRDVPLAGIYDVIVCGGGPAGTAAAVRAAEAGSRTLLLEAHGCLGGIWTSGGLAWMIDWRNKPGFMRELTDELKQRGGFEIPDPEYSSYAADIETLKLLLEDRCAAAGVAWQYHTRAAAALKTDGRLTHVITESKSGRQAWQAATFIDATGDGDLAALAGCGFDYGHPETGKTQPMSLIALVGGIRFDDIREFVCGYARDAKASLMAAMQNAGVTPSYAAPSLFRMKNDIFMMMVNHEYDVSGRDAADITAATIHARREIHGSVHALRAAGGIWQDVHILSTAEQIGVRECRRVHGRYTVTVEDMIKGVRHEDAVCRTTFGIDVHAPDRDNSTGFDHSVRGEHVKTQPYDIPLRALIPRDVNGLMTAGRCISGDFHAHSSYRVTGEAVMLGEAAGIVSAAAVAKGLLPHAIEFDTVRRLLPDK